MRMKNKKSKRYSVSVFISGLLCILFLTTACKYRNNVKEFIEMEIAGGKSDDLVFYDKYAVSANGKTYVPSQKTITGTIPIENEYSLELSAQMFYDESKKALFETLPTVDTAASTPTEIKFTFKFKQDADASTQHPVGQEVPVTVSLIKKLNGTVFATKKFTIRCNTKPSIASVTPDTTSDAFTVTLPTGATDGDIKEARCTLNYTAADGLSQTAVYTIPISKFSGTPKQAHISAKTITKTATKPLALSTRTLSLVLSDYAGLSSAETQSNNNYIYSSGAELTDCKLNVNSTDMAVSFTAQSTDPHRFSASVPISSQSAVFNFSVSPEATLSCTGGSYDPTNHKITITDIPPSGKEVSIIVTSEDEKTKNTYTLTVKKATGVEISETDEKPWKKLKDAVADVAKPNVITINGTIKATNETENSGEILIARNIAIIGKADTGADTLDADALSRIFKVQAGTTLTIQNLTLTGGKTTGSENGGGIYTEGRIILDNCTIENCTTTGNGGGIYVAGGSFIIKGNSKVTVDPDKNDVYLATGKKITLGGSLSFNSVARITPASYTAGTKVLNGDISANYQKFTVTPNGLQKWEIDNSGKLQNDGFVISGSEPQAWKKLKDAVAAATDGDTIFINGTIKATNEPLNAGEILIERNITIIGKAGTGADTLDAATLSRIFKVQAGKTLTIDGLTLTHGQSNDPGGCIHCGGSLIIKNTKIINNEARVGGGIFIVAETNAIVTLQMNRVIISDNIAKTVGGGVYIYLDHAANLTHDSKLTEVTIEKNNLTAGSGAGGAGLVFCTYTKNATLTLDNCTIRGNDAGSLSGGGVYISTNVSGERCGVLNLTNGTTVTGNTAKSGAGIFITGSTCNVDNCTVSGNTATDGGGGIYVGSGTFTIKGNSKVTVDPNNNDVYLAIGKKITLDGSLSSNPAARITPASYTEGTQVLDGDISANYQKFTVTPNGQEKWKIDDSGKLQKESGGTATTTVSTWTELKTAVENSSGTDTITISGTLTATAASDTIKVARSVTIQGTNKATCILDANSKCRIFKIVNVGALTLNNISLTNGKAGGDTDGGGIDNAGSLSLTNVTITNCKSENGKGGAVYNAGTLNLKNTVIKNCMAPGDSGGGIYHVSGTAELDGATIEACSSKQSGGGIYNVGTLTLKNNTTIKNCKVTDLTGDGGGGICNITGASATLDTVSIKSCEASELIGGGIANLGTLTVKNATIENCIAQKDSGGGIANSGTLTLTDTAISTCMAKTNAGHGGAIYTNDGTAKLTNVTINECTSDRNGGAIYCQNTKLEISGSSKISNCTAQSGGALYIRSANNKSVQLTGAASTMINISENKAHKAGGAVYLAGIASNFTFGISNCAFNQNSIEITDVTAGEVHYGGALYSANSLTLTDCTFEANYIGLASGVTSSNTEKKGATIYIADNSNSGNPVVCSLVGTLIQNSEFKTDTTPQTKLFGSGIFVGKNTVLEIDGNSQVESKTNGTVQNRCDIYLTANDGAPYEILGKITYAPAGSSAASIGQITPGIYQTDLSMFTNTSQIPASRFTVTDESNVSKWKVDADGKLKKK